MILLSGTHPPRQNDAPGMANILYVTKTFHLMKTFFFFSPCSAGPCPFGVKARTGGRDPLRNAD
jgi:hypothetical protein